MTFERELGHKTESEKESGGDTVGKNGQTGFVHMTGPGFGTAGSAVGDPRLR